MFLFRSELPLAELGLSDEEGRAWLDFQPFMHQSPHRVPLAASLGSIFRLFRGLGLRHLFVVDDENRASDLFTAFIPPTLQLRGVITRKDVARFQEHKVRGRLLIQEAYISNNASES